MRDGGMDVQGQAQAEQGYASDTPNSIGKAVGLLGDEWVLLILRNLLLEASRYIDLKKMLGISDAVLTDRLRRLTQAEMVERIEGASGIAYQCMAKGKATWPILLAIWDWERTWIRLPGVALPRMRHRTCGALLHTMVVCGDCEQPTGPAELSARWGASGGWARSIPVGSTRRRNAAAVTSAFQGFCSETMSLLGNRWSMALMIGAFLGLRRFYAFQSNLGVPSGLLAQRLEAFCELGVFAVSPSADRGDWYDYELTQKGRAFWPVIVCLTDWALKWMAGEDEGEALILEHKTPAHRFTPVLACRHCGELLKLAEIAVVTQ
ncbi:helix-turn-helix transcriptional regulator [Pseudomonas lactis]|uniref:Helix-turn-helix transcriptional regulator n=1 Tax=Pseudomonas lactis TaxID=1615674 RepID=A0A7Y1M764_9PSED|nr:winged helix-turn-helix transcriptional regulator [Pseudomonas lactis]NNA76496.1 helix-turn-helix transcriptional regulator [Pseudomonas lactis]